ncbi:MULTISPECIES: hypothetical protein [unclassified Streptomyces]|uniref:Uncharacterized protein n=1 Tax=Streptomyces sp. NBC_00060 TaxID=2975636 RepID=A0AAU2HGF1_9ACTN
MLGYAVHQDGHGAVAGDHVARLAAAVVVGNTLSCAALVVLAFTDVIPLTAAGTAFLLIGALVVAVFAEAEFVGCRRSYGHGHGAPSV